MIDGGEGPLDVVVFVCPPGSSQCTCQCATGGPCGHDFSLAPPEEPDALESSMSCRRCGLRQIDHDLMVLP